MVRRQCATHLSLAAAPDLVASSRRKTPNIGCAWSLILPAIAPFRIKIAVRFER
jgi:hypothetical protein